MTEPSPSRKAFTKAKTRPGGRRFQAVMTPTCNERFRTLIDEMECESFGEMVTRALIILENNIDEPTDPSIFPTPGKKDGCTERLQMVLSESACARIARLQAVYADRGEKDLPAMEIIRRALRVTQKAWDECKVHTAGGQKLRGDVPEHRLALNIF